jgi:hypothetical protein
LLRKLSEIRVRLKKCFVLLPFYTERGPSKAETPPNWMDFECADEIRGSLRAILPAGSTMSAWNRNFVRLFPGMSSAYTNSAHIAATNRRHEKSSHGEQGREQGQQGAGSRYTGACGARVKIGKRISIACALLLSTASAELLASTDSPSPAKTSFAYSLSHPVKPLPNSVID